MQPVITSLTPGQASDSHREQLQSKRSLLVNRTSGDPRRSHSQIKCHQHYQVNIAAPRPPRSCCISPKQTDQTGVKGKYQGRFQNLASEIKRRRAKQYPSTSWYQRCRGMETAVAEERRQRASMTSMKLTDPRMVKTAANRFLNESSLVQEVAKRIVQELPGHTGGINDG